MKSKASVLSRDLKYYVLAAILIVAFEIAIYYSGMSLGLAMAEGLVFLIVPMLLGGALVFLGIRFKLEGNNFIGYFVLIVPGCFLMCVSAAFILSLSQVGFID